MVAPSAAFDVHAQDLVALFEAIDGAGRGAAGGAEGGAGGGAEGGVEGGVEGGAAADAVATREPVLDRVRRALSPFVLRRTKAQVLRQLPPKTIKLVLCAMTASQGRAYGKLMQSLGQSWEQTAKEHAELDAAAEEEAEAEPAASPSSSGGGFAADADGSATADDAAVAVAAAEAVGWQAADPELAFISPNALMEVRAAAPPAASCSRGYAADTALDLQMRKMANHPLLHRLHFNAGRVEELALWLAHNAPAEARRLAGVRAGEVVVSDEDESDDAVAAVAAVAAAQAAAAAADVPGHTPRPRRRAATPATRTRGSDGETPQRNPWSVAARAGATKRRRAPVDSARALAGRLLHSLEDMSDYELHRCELGACTRRTLSAATDAWHALRACAVCLRRACACCGRRVCLMHEGLAHLCVDDACLFDSGKLAFLEDRLPRLFSQGHRVLLFSQFVRVLDLLEPLLARLGLRYLRLDGSTPTLQRQALMDAFQSDPGVAVFLLTTRTAGQGLNLTAADTVIIHDPDFNPQCDRQAEDRCHRIGQTRRVTVYRLVSADTVEVKMRRVATEKHALDQAVLR